MQVAITLWRHRYFRNETAIIAIATEARRRRPPLKAPPYTGRTTHVAFRSTTSVMTDISAVSDTFFYVTPVTIYIIGLCDNLVVILMRFNFGDTF